MAGPQYVYVMKGLSKTYPGGRQVLKDIWLSFYPGAKIGIVGVNGAGKSTLMRIMAGQDKDFTGEAWAADGIRTGYLPQEPQLDATKDVRANVMDAVAAKQALAESNANAFNFGAIRRRSIGIRDDNNPKDDVIVIEFSEVCHSLPLDAPATREFVCSVSAATGIGWRPRGSCCLSVNVGISNCYNTTAASPSGHFNKC